MFSELSSQLRIKDINTAKKKYRRVGMDGEKGTGEAKCRVRCVLN